MIGAAAAGESAGELIGDSIGRSHRTRRERSCASASTSISSNSVATSGRHRRPNV